MRLVYLNGDPGVPWLGCKGASVHARGLAKALARRVEKLTVVTARRSPRRGRAVAASFGYEVLEAGVPHGSDDAQTRAFAVNDDIARLLGDVAVRGDADAIYERLWLGGVAGAEAARRGSIPRIVEVNAPLVLEAGRHRGLSLRSLCSFVERRVLLEADRVVVVSSPLATHVRELGVDPTRVSVLPNAYDGDLFDALPPRTPASGPDAPFTVMFVGSLKPWHGLDQLIAAFEQFHGARPHSRLAVIGDGPLAPDLEARLGRVLPRSAYHLSGAVGHEEVPALLRSADVAVAPYPAMEGFYFSPLKILEYAAAGRPIIASDIGQIRELLVDGTSALLVPPGDVRALAQALGRLADDAGLRTRLGRAAREEVRGRSWDDVAGRVVALFDGTRSKTTCEVAP